MEFIKILFNSAFAVLPLLIILQLQIILIINPVLTVTPPSAEYVQNNVETVTTTSITTATTVQTATTTTTIVNNNNNNKNNTITKQPQQQQQHEEHVQRKREQIIDNSIDFTVEPCDDFYQYACGEWKQQMYGNGLKPTTTTTTKHSGNVDTNADADVDIVDIDDDDNDGNVRDNFDRDFGNFNDTNGDYMYDRTLAMIDYMADKEVLKYFYERNRTKFLNKIASTTASTTATATIPTTKRNTINTNTTIKEPDLIIKVYKYYKSCITIEQYEPIRYLEWLELNEHVKWPSLINDNTTTTANSEEHNDYSNEKENTYQKEEMPNDEGEQQQQVQEGEEEEEEIEEIMMDDDNGDGDGDGDVNDTTATTAATTTTTAAKDEDNNPHNWIKTLAILRRYGLNGIFIEEIMYNTKTYPSKLFLGFSKPTQDGGFKSLKMDNLKTILLHLNETYTDELFKELWLKVTKFEWQLTKLNDITDELGTLMVTLKQLPVTWLHDYMMVIFNQTQPMHMNMRVIITNVGYFLALDDLIREYDEHFLQQYLKIRFLWYLYQQEPYDFSPLECIQHIKRFQPLAFEWIYEQRRQEMKQQIPEIQNIYSNIRRQFNLTLYNNRNNFATAKLEKFVTKLESIQIKVGTFIDLRNENVFYENRKFYKTLKLSSRLYYTNRLKMLKFNFDCLHFGLQNLASTSLYYDMKEYSRGLASAAYFNRRLNTLNIPLSLLQPPIYHKEYNELQKYTTLGFILAQTLMYGFDLNELVLNDQHQHFKCLGNLDSSEVSDKIADVSGFRLAYHTFFHSNAKNLISNRKMFFLNFAHTFCATRSSDDTVGRSYVNYALAQFQEFAKVFECPPDSHMNPHEKCYLWD